MAYEEKLADRVRELLSAETSRIQEKRMFGGLCFMVNNKMCVAVKADEIMLRISPEETEKAAEHDFFRPMMRNGKTIQGFGYIRIEALQTKKQLAHWVYMALKFNQAARATKKKPAPSKSKKRQTP